MKKKNLLILLFATLLLFSSCQSTEYRGRTMNVLDTSVEREDFHLISENGYKERMDSEVVPFLQSIVEKGTFASNIGNHRIYYEIYDIEDEKGSVVLLHGFTEFIQKYREIIYYFTQAGYDVYMAEHYGHGYSERDELTEGNLSKVAVDEFSVYVDDAFQFITDVVNKKRDRNKPFILFGHSMGGGIGTRLLEKYPSVFDAAILSSPMIEIETGATPEWIAKFFAGSANAFGAGGDYIFGHYDYTPEDLFEDPSCPASSYERYKYALELRAENEYYQMYGATWSWLNASIDATKKMVEQEEAQKVRIPVLLFQAENDSLVRSGGQLEFAAKAYNVNVVYCPGAHHEIFNSPDEIAYAYWVTIFDFLDEVL